MTGAHRALVTAVLVAASACSLGRRTPELHYYVLAVPGTPPSALDAPVRIGVFTADQPYATTRLAYRTSPYRLDYYTYHRWAADPRQMIPAAIRDYLERAASRDGGPPYVVEGHVRRLEEVDQSGGRVGAIGLEVRVQRAGRIVLASAYEEVEPAAEANPEAVAAALSRALGRILDRIAADLTAAGMRSGGRPWASTS